MYSRTDTEQREQLTLAGYAAKSSESKGRVYPTDEHKLRTAYQRDRDRIVHCTAFRRLEYKTQVFIPHETDHFRTRLTHTIEVAQIGRTIARALGLNEDLTEAIALVHDLGHTPFGHAGEHVLDHLIRNFGGFNHNRQSLRIVDLLEASYADHPGLNLTYEVREGIVKHETKGGFVPDEFAPEQQPTLEALLVDIADEIAYNSHDMDDGLSSQLLNLEMIQKSEIGHIFKELPDDKSFSNPDMLRHSWVRFLVNKMSSDLINHTSDNLESNSINTIDDVRNSLVKLVSFSDKMKTDVLLIKKFLSENLYRHEKLLSMTEWAGEIIEQLFAHLIRNRSLLPQRYQERILTEPIELVVADYIAGMTDRFAIKMYEDTDS